MTQQADATVIVASGSHVTWTAGWYVVNSTVTITGGADCSGAVKLILADGAKLTINSVAADNAGIGVSGEGHSFTVYGQTEGTGLLVADNVIVKAGSSANPPEAFPTEAEGAMTIRVLAR